MKTKVDFGNTKEKVRIRLTRNHFVDGVEKKAGYAIELGRWAAEWLVAHKRAVLVSKKKG